MKEMRYSLALGFLTFLFPVALPETPLAIV